MPTWVERNPFAVTLGLLICVLGIFLVFFLAASKSAPVPSLPQLLPPSEYDERLLVLDKEGIEDAYRQQVTLLFKNWMNDPKAGQPQRALTGLRNAAKAYIEAMDGAKKREEQLQLRRRQ